MIQASVWIIFCVSCGAPLVLVDASDDIPGGIDQAASSSAGAAKEVDGKETGILGSRLAKLHSFMAIDEGVRSISSATAITSGLS